MEEHTVYDDDGKGFTKIFSGTDIEFANPIEYYKNREIQRSMSLERTTLSLKNPIITASLPDAYFLKRANEKWEERLAQINSDSVPGNFISLLNTQSKHEQEKLLRGQSITPFQLAAYLFRAWTDFGYSFSNYRAEHHHKGVSEQDLPQLIRLDEENVRKAGTTSLTDGQLKNVVNHRKVIVSKILDRGSEWHCFFITYNSIAGKEKWQGGQPHYHYISDKWGLSRQEAVDRLKSTNYPPTSVHIALIE